MAILENFRKDDAGAVAVLTGFMAVVLLVAAGGAIDYGRSLRAKTRLQSAADSAALAAAAKLGAPDAERIALANKVFDKNLREIGQSPTRVVTLSTDTASVTGTLQVPQLFLPLIGIETVNLSATAIAKAESKSASASRICVLSLNPAGAQSFYMYGSGELLGPNCRFHANSKHFSDAMVFQGAGSAHAADFCATGAVAVGSTVTITPTPRSNCDVVKDPLSTWLAPTIPATCNFGHDGSKIVGTTINSQGVTTLVPGRYCGATKISADVVVLQPGRYFFTEGTLSISAGTDVVGEGVYIHIGASASSATINGGARVRLTHLPDADLKGVIFHKEPASVKFKSTISGNGDVFLNGVVYMPKDDFEIAGNSDTKMTQQPDVTLIADRIVMQGGAHLEIKADLTAGVGQNLFPVSTSVSGARLVQ